MGKEVPCSWQGWDLESHVEQPRGPVALWPHPHNENSAAVRDKPGSSINLPWDLLQIA